MHAQHRSRGWRRGPWDSTRIPGRPRGSALEPGPQEAGKAGESRGATGTGELAGIFLSAGKVGPGLKLTSRGEGSWAHRASAEEPADSLPFVDQI